MQEAIEVAKAFMDTLTLAHLTLFFANPFQKGIWLMEMNSVCLGFRG
jgi:hypothetical protein